MSMEKRVGGESLDDAKSDLDTCDELLSKLTVSNLLNEEELLERSLSNPSPPCATTSRLADSSGPSVLVSKALLKKQSPNGSAQTPSLNLTPELGSTPTIEKSPVMFGAEGSKSRNRSMDMGWMAQGKDELLGSVTLSDFGDSASDGLTPTLASSPDLTGAKHQHDAKRDSVTENADFIRQAQQMLRSGNVSPFGFATIGENGGTTPDDLNSDPSMALRRESASSPARPSSGNLTYLIMGETTDAGGGLLDGDDDLEKFLVK